MTLIKGYCIVNLKSNKGVILVQIKHPNLAIQLQVSRRVSRVHFGNLLIPMQDCGISVVSLVENDFCPEHITNCLEPELVFKYIKRFLACTSESEVFYIKTLARKGLFEGDTLKINGKDSKILHWHESTQQYPMFVTKTVSGNWGKQKKLLYSNYTLTDYKNFNHPVPQQKALQG